MILYKKTACIDLQAVLLFGNFRVDWSFLSIISTVSPISISLRRTNLISSMRTLLRRDNLSSQKSVLVSSLIVLSSGLSEYFAFRSSCLVRGSPLRFNRSKTVATRSSFCSYRYSILSA